MIESQTSAPIAITARHARCECVTNLNTRPSASHGSPELRSGCPYKKCACVENIGDPEVERLAVAGKDSGASSSRTVRSGCASHLERSPADKPTFCATDFCKHTPQPSYEVPRTRGSLTPLDGAAYCLLSQSSIKVINPCGRRSSCTGRTVMEVAGTL
jgi:hypothetical protein